MSWAGILRPSDEFAPAAKSQLAVISADSVTRYFGKWSNKYSRFATNLTSAKIRVKTVALGEVPTDGIQCIIHWVDREDVIRSDKGSVCYGDGWPKKLWNLFTSEMQTLPQGTVAEKLRNFLDSDLQEENELVSLWRKRLKTGSLVGSDQQRDLDEYWLPVPATLVLNDETETHCIFSWSPGAHFYKSLSEALSSSEVIERKPNYHNLAKYYLECVLAKLHGVRFDPEYDFIEDEVYSNRAEVKELVDSFTLLEKERISDRRFGQLDRFGFAN